MSCDDDVAGSGDGVRVATSLEKNGKVREFDADWKVAMHAVIIIIIIITRRVRPPNGGRNEANSW